MRDKLRSGATASAVGRPESASSLGACSAPVSLLADDRMTSTAMTGVRAELAHVLQRAAGNRALGQVLAREDGDGPYSSTAQGLGLDEPAAKVSEETVDAQLAANPLLKPYVTARQTTKDKKRRRLVKGHVKAYGEKEFSKKAGKYLKERDPTLRGEKLEKHLEQLEGFRDCKKIRVRKGFEESSTLIHEAIHLYSDSNDLYEEVGFWGNEGTTEYFTRLVTGHLNIQRGSKMYANERSVIDSVVYVLGNDGPKLLADAYFKNELDPLKQKFNALPAGKPANGWDDFAKEWQQPDTETKWKNLSAMVSRLRG